MATPSPLHFICTTLADNGKKGDNSELDKESPSHPSLSNALGHQDAHSTGGSNKNLEVLYYTNVYLPLHYQALYMVKKPFGNVEKMKLNLALDKKKKKNIYILCCILFSSYNSVNTAQKFNPFVSIGCTGTSKGKVKVRDIV